MKHLLTSGLMTGALLASVAGCTDRLTVPNYQNITTTTALSSPAAALPLLATGVLRDERGELTGFVNATGILGRESYNYTPTEGRNTSGYLTSDALNSTSFVASNASLWNNEYTGLRDIFQMRGVANGAAPGTFTAAQLNAINGFLDTEEALNLLYVIDARDDIGAPVQVFADPAAIAPFVSRDSVFNYISAKLSGAITELNAGGGSFPFTLHSGFAGFDTPANFAKFASALLARVNAYKASRGLAGCGVKSAACYATVLQNLSGSFINPGGSLKTGVYDIYSTAAGDAANTISRQQAKNVVAHARVNVGVQTKPDGSLDARFVSKVCTIPSKGPSTPTLGIPTTFAYCGIYAVSSDPVPIIRNEELILLRAEAEYYTGDQASALSDINLIRTTSGGLAARGPFTSESDFLDELLYNRRESLMFEGHRWIDMRRFGRLNQLPIDSNDPLAAPNITPQVMITRVVVGQGECLYRANAPANLKAPAGSGCSTT